MFNGLIHTLHQMIGCQRNFAWCFAVIMASVIAFPVSGQVNTVELTIEETLKLYREREALPLPASTFGCHYQIPERTAPTVESPDNDYINLPMDVLQRALKHVTSEFECGTV